MFAIIKKCGCRVGKSFASMSTIVDKAIPKPVPEAELPETSDVSIEQPAIDHPAIEDTDKDCPQEIGFDKNPAIVDIDMNRVFDAPDGSPLAEHIPKPKPSKKVRECGENGHYDDGDLDEDQVDYWI